MKRQPSLGIVCPTPGRKSIWRMIQSCVSQGLIEGDDILLVGDGRHKATEKLVECVGPPFRYIHTPLSYTWGHTQENVGIKRVGGDVIILQGDDDCFAPRAFEVIRELVAEYPNTPLMGRVLTPYRGLIWTNSDNVLKDTLGHELYDGHCLVIPNVKEKLGYAGLDYMGDQVYIRTCLEPYTSVNWIDRIISLCRPQWKLYDYPIGGSLHSVREGFEQDPNTKALIVDIERVVDADEDVERAWCWGFRTFITELPIAMLYMWRYSKDGPMYGAMSFLGGQEHFAGEVVEYAYWAAQGVDLRVQVDAGDYEIIEALKLKGLNKITSTEWMGTWPPKFFKIHPGKLHKSGIILPPAGSP